MSKIVTDLSEIKIGQRVSIETGGDLMPPLLPRAYEGRVVYGRDEEYANITIESPDGAEITFTFGDHIRVMILPPLWEDLTGEQRYWFEQGWRAKRDSTEHEPRFAYESIHDLPTEGAAA